MLFIFRSLYLCAIGLWPVFSFRRHLPPVLSSIPKLLDSSKEPHTGWASDRTGLSPSAAPRSRGLGRRPRPRRPLQITTRAPRGGGPDFKFELLPLHSPLLGQSLLVSFPPLIDMLKFSGYPYLIRGQPLFVCVVLAGARRALRSERCYYARRGGGPAAPFRGLRAARRAPAQAGLDGWR